MIFQVDPYKAIGDAEFGMSGTALTTKVGAPKRVAENAIGDMEYQYDGFIFRLRNDSVVEASFSPSCEVIASGSDVFSDPNAFNHLVAVDGDPREFVGFIILYRLGLALTGFHDEDESQKAVTVVTEGRWDHMRARSVAFS